ncbi:MAG: hypothetical protein ACRD4P_08200 [Bryobacteraceae bacterium]
MSGNWRKWWTEGWTGIDLSPNILCVRAAASTFNPEFCCHQLSSRPSRPDGPEDLYGALWETISAPPDSGTKMPSLAGPAHKFSEFFTDP